MEIKGKIIAVLEVKSGSSSSGEWTSQDAVLETFDQYPKKVCFNMWKDKIVPLQIGQEVNVSFDIESKEYNGRWFTNCRAWKVEGQTAPVQTTTAPPPAQYAPPTQNGDEPPV